MSEKFFGMEFDDRDREWDLDIPQHRARKNARKNKDKMDLKVREIAEREQVRRPGYSGEVRTYFVDPASL